jgi:L-threonine kinase
MAATTGHLIGSATAKSPGTCGEFVQGIRDGIQFLVTCPIEMYSHAHVDALEGEGRVFGPADCQKACKAAELTLAHLNLERVDIHLSLTSDLPRGKGMASSTADVTAAICATAAAVGASLSPAEIARIALAVEPSDGTMFSGIVMFDHRKGKLLTPLGEAPPMRILVLDFGGTVDTLEYNSVDRLYALRRNESVTREAADLVMRGVRNGDIGLIGEGATISGRAHQALLLKPNLDEVIAICPTVGAVGANVAHSGTVIGLLLPNDERTVARARKAVRERFPDLENLIETRLIGGGVSVVAADAKELPT